MSQGAFSEVIHAPLRFRICGLLRQADKVAFSTLREALDVSDDVLSKHLRILSEAGFVTMTRQASADRHDRRRLTWVRLTRQGNKAFADHLAALRQIAGGHLVP